MTLLEDFGRFGYEDFGLSSSGVLDERAYFWACKLLGNDIKNSNALEISFGGLELLSHGKSVIAFCGAKSELWINEQQIKSWQTYSIKEGDSIKVGRIISGEKLYLCIKNGFRCEKFYGSCSVSLREKIFYPLKVGEKLEFMPFHGDSLCSFTPKQFMPTYDKPLVLRFIPNFRHCNMAEMEQFINSNYKVSSQKNRMGIRLDGDEVILKNKGILSEPTTLGLIQIPPNGKAIILLKERQTIGGYPSVGAVFALDLFNLVQAKSGTKLKFEAIDIKTAEQKLREFYLFFS